MERPKPNVARSVGFSLLLAGLLTAIVGTAGTVLLGPPDGWTLLVLYFAILAGTRVETV